MRAPAVTHAPWPTDEAGGIMPKKDGVDAVHQRPPNLFRYRAESWDRDRRVMAKVEQDAGELFPRVGAVATSLMRGAKRVSRFYNGRGTAEQWIKEGNNALKWTRLSCRRFRDNQARLQLFALAYNLANFLRRLRCRVR